MRRVSLSAAAVALGLLLTACGSDEKEQPRVTAAQQCDGTLSPAAAKALESVLRAEKFLEADSGGLKRTVDQLIEDQAREGRPPGHPAMCEVTTDQGLEMRVEFRLYERDDLYDDGRDWTTSGRHLYALGREASSDNETARLFVGCTSPRLKGSSERPAPIQGLLRFDKPLKGALPDNTPATREAYLTVLHSVTLAVVKELGCENDAGLPERPVLTEKKWRGER